MENKTNFLEIARENFKRWNEALQTKDVEKIAALYSEDFSFLPTFSRKFITDKAELKDYFKHFCEKNPVGKIIEEKIQPFGEDFYIHSGLYDFEVDAKGARNIANARPTFCFAKENGEWKIVHHHSSGLPD